MIFGGMTRRALLANGTMMLGTGAALTSFFGLSRTRDAFAQEAGAPTETLTVGTTIPFTTLDPNAINTSVFPLRNSLFDPLLRIPVTDIATFGMGEIEPVLAESYTVNDERTEIRLKIRQGVTFHDGSPMTIEDVLASLQHALDPKTGLTVAGSIAAITSAAIEGDEIVLRTDKPSVGALYRLSLFRVQSPRHFDTVANAPVGTGLFKMGEFVPGDHLTLERNESYWKPVASNVKTLNFRFFTDPESMLNSALAGELDILQFGQLKDAQTLKDSGWNAYQAPTADYILLVLNYEGPNEVLKNPDIRQAIARAIDRKTIAETVFFGLVDPITIPMPRSAPTYDAEIAGEWDFNLEKAAEFVKKSGIENPTFELRAYANDPSNRLIAQIIQGDLAKIGITANIALTDPTTMVNDAIAGNFQSNVYACSIGVPDVADFEDCSVYRHSTGPFSGDKTFPDFVEAYQAASAVVDPTERTEAFKGVFRIVHERAWAIPIVMRGQLFAEAGNIKGVAYDAKTHLVYDDIVKS